MTDKELIRFKELNFLGENGMLFDEESQLEFMMLSNKNLIEKYKISTSKDGCRCRVNGKQVHRKDMASMLDYLRRHETEEGVTLKQVFEEAKNHAVNRLNKPVKMGTITEYDKMYNKHMKQFSDKGIKSFKPKDVVTIFNNAKGMSKSEYNKVRDVIRLIFGFAYSLNVSYIDWDVNSAVFNRIDRNDFIKPRVRKTCEELAFSECETKAILTYCSEHIDVKNCAIALMFGTGLRPGEVVALHRDCVNGMILTIKRSELRYDSKDKNGKNHTVYEIQESVKNENALRNVAVFDCQWSLIWLLHQNNDFICSENGKIITTKNLTDRLKLICRKLNISPRSVNKIRKTVATKLNECGVSEADILKQLGHSSFQVTKDHYIQDREPVIERLCRLEAKVTKSNT